MVKREERTERGRERGEKRRKRRKIKGERRRRKREEKCHREADNGEGSSDERAEWKRDVGRNCTWVGEVCCGLYD